MILKIKNESVAVSIKKYEYENVDKEIILYQSDTEKILVMNETASFIWLYICDLSSHDSNIADFDITQSMMEEYDVEQDSHEHILDDVRGLLDIFFIEGLLKNEDSDI